MSKNDGKRKERKAVIEKYLGGLFSRTEGYARNVSRYYTAAVEALLDLAATADMNPDEVFRFSDHKRLSAKATNILRGLYSAVYQEIRRGVAAEWEYANLSADAMITSLFGKDLQEDNHFARWFARNQEAMDSFFSRKEAHGGLNLSQKVWKYTGQLKEEMEIALSVSLGRGDSAATVSRQVRQYLRDPNRLFRRVRDAEGNLKLSKRAAAFHPGRGEYRSSYKNAMRLTRTETNMAYRAADCDRWSRIPFVVGMEVKRSNHPFGCEVCEALQGKYPKDFVFTGWHPQCRCYIVPVLASEEERMAYHRAVLNGEDVSGWHFKGEITEPHEGFRKWVKENEERIENAQSLPYWMRDNGKYVKGAATEPQPTVAMGGKDNYSTISAKLIPTETKDVSMINEKLTEIVEHNPDYFAKGFKGVEAVSTDSSYMSTSMDGKISINFGVDKNGFNAGESIVSAFEKLQKGLPLAQNEEYSIEILWHEILHNKSLNTAVLPPIEAVDVGFTRCVAETINQLVARHSYGDFLEQLGGKMQHSDWVLKNGYGYNATVRNLRYLLKHAGIDEREFVEKANKILMEDYTHIDKKIGNLLESMEKTGISNIKWKFGCIEMEHFKDYF